MQFYQMASRVPSNGTLINERNNRRCDFWSGQALTGQLQLPVEFKLDSRFLDGLLPTFYDTPAFVAKRSFHQALLAAGVSNVEAFPALIIDETSSRTIDDYVLLNVIGLVACADMQSSEHDNLGDDDNPIVAIDRLVLRAGGHRWPDLFLTAEDSQVIVISAHLHDALTAAHYDDVYFEALEQSQ